MKSQNPFIAALALAALGALNTQLSTAHAQGSLTPPPGAPAPVMKSLDQIEARTPLLPGAPGVTYANGAYTITQPGSYYLVGHLTATNLTDALIRLTANNVTLDLNGFTLFGTNGLLPAAISGQGQGYRILNGQIVGGTTQTNGVFTSAGFTMGLYFFSANPNFGAELLVSGLTVRGMRFKGIDVSLNGVVQNCVVDTTSDLGISAGTVTGCQAINAGGHGIIAGTVLNSTGKSVGSGDGISSIAAQPSTVQNSSGESATGTGVSAGTALNCFGKSVAGPAGIFATIANSCIGHRTGGVAINATIGIGCHPAAGSVNIVNKYNMP